MHEFKTGDLIAVKNTHILTDVYNRSKSIQIYENDVGMIISRYRISYMYEVLVKNCTVYIFRDNMRMISSYEF